MSEIRAGNLQQQDDSLTKGLVAAGRQPGTHRRPHTHQGLTQAGSGRLAAEQRRLRDPWTRRRLWARLGGRSHPGSGGGAGHMPRDPIGAQSRKSGDHAQKAGQSLRGWDRKGVSGVTGALHRWLQWGLHICQNPHFTLCKLHVVKQVCKDKADILRKALS